MAGGVFTSHNKVRPGAYINVISKSGSQQSASTSGIVALPLVLDFGPEDIKVVTATTNLDEYGSSLADNLLLGEALKRAATVLVGRVNGGGSVATATDEGGLTATATSAGVGGNEINVTVSANVDSDEFTVTTYLGTVSKDVQTASKIEDLKDNALVKFSGTGDLVAIASLALSGGTNATAQADGYRAFLEKLEVYDFNTIALPVEDESIKATFASYVKRLRDDEGKKCQLVVAGYNADSEAVINVRNGVVLADGTVIEAVQATAWVAGATAGAAVNESLTYSAYDGAVDVHGRLIHSEIVEALLNGEFVFTERRGRAVVEQDINSLVTYGSQKGPEFRKNRTLRVLDDIANTTLIAFEDFFIGSVNNDVDGRELLKSNRIAYFNGLQEIGAIDEFTPEDIVILAGDAKDEVVGAFYVKTIDAMEKLYVQVYSR